MPSLLSELPVTLPQATSIAAILPRFRAVREATMRFVQPLSPEDLMVQSCPEASPAKWHLAHTSWFFETFVLADYLPGYQAFHPEFRWLFNSYYNALGDMPEKKLRASFSRPPLDSILAYRTHVDAAVGRLLESPLDAQTEAEVLPRVALGLEHEQQHLELLATDIKHALWTNPLHPAYLEDGSVNDPIGKTTAELTFSHFPGGVTEIGVSPDPSDPLAFAFDNETPRHKVYLQPFALADRLVTAGEYLAFMAAGGYTRPELWLSEGWTAIRAAGWQAPLYWRAGNDAKTVGESWEVYTLHGFRPLSEVLDTPVCHLSFFEADAFARWSGCRLPTEFEWEHAAVSLGTPVREPDGDARLLSWPTGTAKRAAATANMLETGALHPTPASPLGGLGQIFGDVWEWTSSGYTGYPGYRPLPGALGEYNGKFMSSQVILRGGSAVTPATHIRATYRNFFPPSTRWQFSGLRLAKDV